METIDWVLVQFAMLAFGATIFLSSFLLFLVQPIIARQILPWFGGSSAVWATCLVFSQSALLAGYAYADFVVHRVRLVNQLRLHLVLLVISLLWLPIIPNGAWKPVGGDAPVIQILGLLLSTIGLPYLVLSTTSPVVQAWYWQRFSKTAPYRLFALSNFGSLLALVSYPTLVEPWLSTNWQTRGWSTLYAVFAGLCAITGFVTRRTANDSIEVNTESSVPVANVDAPLDFTIASDGAPAWYRMLMWFLLSATGSCLLQAVTNHLTQNVSSVPFLWILPLGLYLVTFILTFDHPRWYSRLLFLLLLGVTVPTMALFLDSLKLEIVVPIYTLGLFAGCMFCHGELVNTKPSPRHLTRFYLLIALGGAAGSILIGVLAPLVLKASYELGIVLVAIGALATIRLWPSLVSVGIAATVTSGTLVLVWNWGDHFSREAYFMSRNFYGVVRIRDYQYPSPFRGMLHGSILHGGQLRGAADRRIPTTYFGPRSGYGRLFDSLKDDHPRKIGVIGLGAGALAVYCRPQDTIVFYELDPQVVDLARSEFTYLKDLSGQVEIVVGDGRLALEREPPRGYDVLAIDAFAGDSIPMHLLTREAMQIYVKHLSPNGVIVFQATNRFVDIPPAVARVSQDLGLSAVNVDNLSEPKIGPDWQFPSEQVLVSRDGSQFELEPLKAAASSIQIESGLEVFTDDYSNLLKILKIRKGLLSWRR